MGSRATTSAFVATAGLASLLLGPLPSASAAARPQVGVSATSVVRVSHSKRNPQTKATKVLGWNAARRGARTRILDSLRVTGPGQRVVKVQKMSASRWTTMRVLRTSFRKRLDAGFIRDSTGPWRLKVPARGAWRGVTTAPTVPTPSAPTGEVFSVVGFGAVGDGVVDDTAAVQAALTAAGGVGGTVVVPAGTYRISRVLTVPAGTTVSGSGVIRQVSAGVGGLRVVGDGVTVEGITVTGRHVSAVYAGGEYAVWAQGVAGSPLRDLVVRDVSMSGWGAYGVYLRQVTGFRVSGCVVSDVGYTGIGVLTGSQGVIADNRVDNVRPGSSGNAYGIVMSYAGSEAESTDIVVRGNTVSRVFWEGIDAHGGSRLTIDGNTVRDSGDGIALTSGTTAAHLGSNNTVTNNLIEDSSKRAVLVAGQSSVLRVGNTISGNTFRRNAGGVLAFDTKALVVSNNIFQESSAVGVYLDYHNTNFQVTGNAFVDMWSNTAWTAGVHTAESGGTNTGLIATNTLQRGSKRKTAQLNDYGYYYRGGRTGITTRDNNFTAATYAPIAGEG